MRRMILIEFAVSKCASLPQSNPLSTVTMNDPAHFFVSAGGVEDSKG